MSGATHRLHKGVIQVRQLVHRLDHLGGLFERHIRVALLYNDLGARFIQRCPGHIEELFRSVVTVRAFVPLNREEVQSGLGVPVTVGHYCDSRFDIRTAEFDHRMHTRAVFDARVVVLLYLPKEDRRRFGRGIEHAREAHVDSICDAAVYPQRCFEELRGLVH